MIPERAYADNVSFCATVTGAPAEECEALMNIYDTTGGEDWTDITGWGTSTTICAWTGVTCSDNHITALDLSGKNLKGDFVVTTGNLNALTYLNLSSNGLTSVDSRGLNSLQTLEIQNNLFTTFSGTWPKVTYLDISSNQLVSFDGAGLTGLVSLAISNNILLPSLTLSSGDLHIFVGGGMSALTSLNLSGNRLSSFDGTVGFDALTTLNLNNNWFTTFSGIGLTKLTHLNLSANHLTTFTGTGLDSLTTLNVSNNSALVSFTFSNNTLTSFTGTGMTALKSLNLSGNKIATFDVTGLNMITYLNLSDNLLTSLTGTGMTALKTFELQDNLLTTFSSGTWPALIYLDISNNRLTSFVSTGLNALISLYISSNASLSDLTLSNGKLTTFVGGGLGGLTSLNLSGNQLASFDASVGFGGLTTLNLSNNLLTTFSNVGLTSLITLTLNNNQLTSFSSAGLGTGVLKTLNLSYNQLSSFEGTTGLKELTVLDISHNTISSLNTNVKTLTKLPSSSTPAGRTAFLSNFAYNCLDQGELNASFGTWLTSRSKEDWKIQNTSCPFTSQTMYFFGTSPNPTDWNQQTNWYTDVLHKTPITLKSRPDGADNAIILTDVSRNTGLPAVVKTLQVRDSTISIPISNTVGTALATQMPGPNNDIIWTAVNPGDDGKAITMTYTSPTDQEATIVSISGKDITITPATEGYIYVTNYGGNTLQKFRALNMSQIGSPISAGHGTFFVTLSPDDLYAYVTTWGGSAPTNMLLKFRTSDMTLIGSAPTGVDPLSVVISPDGLYAYVVNRTSFTLQKFRTTDMIQIGDNIKTGNYPLSIDISPDGLYVYVVNAGSNTLQKFSTTTMTQVGSNTVTGSSPHFVDLSPDGLYAYIVNMGSDTLQKFSTNTMTQVGTNVSTGVQPIGVNISSDGLYAYVINYQIPSSFQKFRLSDMTQVGSNVVLGYYPGAIALSSDGAYAYITSSWDSTLKKYRTSDMTQVSSIATGSWPYGIALSHAGSTNQGSSASQVIAAVAANPAAAALITGTLAPGNDGTGAVTAMPKTYLFGSGAYPVPMTFYRSTFAALDTSISGTTLPPLPGTPNILTGDAVFDCTSQNLGIVTGTTTFSKCAVPTSPPELAKYTVVTTPTFTGKCLANTIVSLYSGTTALMPSAICTDRGEYAITTTLAPGSYSITARQSNRSGALSSLSDSSPVLPISITCPGGLSWNGIACSSVCTTTEAPSELQANIDKPYIACNNTNTTTKTHFKYRISKPGEEGFTPIESGVYAASEGTRVLYDGTFSDTENSQYAAGSLDPQFIIGKSLNYESFNFFESQTDGKILIRGIFTSYNGVARPGIVRLNTDGSVDTTFDPGTGDSWVGVNERYFNPIALQPDGKIIIYGTHTSYNGVARPGIVRLNTDGSVDTSFDTGTNAGTPYIHFHFLPGGKILVYGWFTTFNGVTRNHIVRLNENGSIDPTFLNPTGVSYSNIDQIFLLPDGKILTYGNGYLARLNADGSVDTTFNGTGYGVGVSGYIEDSVFQPDGKLLVSGGFTSQRGVAIKNIARFNTDGALDMTFNPGTGTNSSYFNQVTLLPNKKILLTGGFTTYNGVPKAQIALLNENGSLDTAFDAGTVSNYYSIFQWKPKILNNGKIVISGPFTTYNGVARPGIVRLNTDGSVDTTFYPSGGIQGATAHVKHVQPDDKILVNWNTSTGGGYSTSYNYIGRINSDPTTVQNDYKVECIYGDATMSNPITDTCTKNIIVRESTSDNVVQGCASIGNNYENTVGYEQWINTTSAFNAHINCYARKGDPAVTNPFLLGYTVDQETSFVSLGYLGGLVPAYLGRMASVSDFHTFQSSISTTLTCAVRVGDGYSTNSLCQNTGCGGEKCDKPAPCVVIPADLNLFSTHEEFIRYTIGSGVDQQCSIILGEGNIVTFRIDGVDKDYVMTCTGNPLICTVLLPTGKKEISLKLGPNQYQPIYDIVSFDSDPPLALIDASDPTLVSADKKLLSSSQWLKKPFTATITCYNESIENNDNATCAWLLKTGIETPKDSTEWQYVPPLKDIVPYQRVIGNEILNNQTFYVYDNAGNSDTTKSKVTINLGVDGFPPSVTMKSESVKTDGTIEVVLRATDNGSGLWQNPIQAQAVAIPAGGGMIDLKSQYTDGYCGVTPIYDSFPVIGATSRNSGPIKYNPLNEKIVYCIQDNAGNQLIGTYPFNADSLIGCFSDGSQQVVPNLDESSLSYYQNTNFEALLGARIDDTNPKKYGYAFTDAALSTQMTDFHTKLSQNIETFVRRQYCPTTTFMTSSIDLGERITSTTPALQYAAKVKGTSCNTNNARNNNGYYYFKGDTANTILELSGVPRLSGSKVVVVEGADIYIRGDIHYLARDSSLVIIALKDTAGRGGNIYVHPDVTAIDATLIADGALMNGVREGSSITPKVWFDETAEGDLKNPLTINGRLLTHNTRGGSLVYNVSATPVLKLASGNGICAVGSGAVSGSSVCSSIARAGSQDLERFRVVTRTPDDDRCTLHVTGVTAENRPDILTQVQF